MGGMASKDNANETQSLEGLATKEVSMDIIFSLGSFASTTATVEAVSEKGAEFLGAMFGTVAGVAPTSVTIPKSKGADLLRFAQQRGLAVL